MLNIPLLMADDGLVRAGLAAEYRFDDAKNIMPVGSDNFVTGWAAQNGANVVVTPNQSVAAWGITDAKRIQTTGGTATVKYNCTIASPSINLQNYYFRVYVKNIGDKALRINGNVSGNVTVNPGETTIATMTVVGNGATSLVFRIITLDAADSLDFLMFQPMVSLSPITQYYPPAGFPQNLMDYSVPDTNLIVASKINFEGWSTFGGATVTLTQNQSVPEWITDKATRIQTSGGDSPTKYLYGMGLSKPGEYYSAQLKVKNIGTKTVRISLNGVPLKSLDVLPGQIAYFKETTEGAGIAYKNLQIGASNVSDTIDVLVYEPMINDGGYQSYVRPKNNGTLGSTTGADTNDPTWTGQGLSFGGNQYTKLPYMIDVQQDFSMYVVTDITSITPVATEFLIGFGNSSIATQYGGLYKSTTSADRVNFIMQNDAGTSVVAILSGLTPGRKLLKVQRKNGQYAIKDVASGVISPAVNAPANPITFNNIALGAVVRTTVASYLNGSEYAASFYNRVITDVEDMQIYNNLKRLLVQRGTAI